MIYHILAVGDVVGEQGLAHLEASLRPLKRWKDIHFTVVNGENAALLGVTPDQVERLYAAGALTKLDASGNDVECRYIMQ